MYFENFYFIVKQNDLKQRKAYFLLSQFISIAIQAQTSYFPASHTTVIGPNLECYNKDVTCEIIKIAVSCML